MSSRDFEICIDANEPDRLRPFWLAALGYIEVTTSEGVNDLVDPDGIRPTVWFQRVAEPKTSKNRMHLDIRVPPAERDRMVEELVALGGTVVKVYERFTTLADPEGNELCLAAH